MRTFKVNNQSGFSLVELMVVVAIIGILATVAIPSVSKYMAKARQSEAKAALSSLYSANKSFFVEYKRKKKSCGQKRKKNYEYRRNEKTLH